MALPAFWNAYLRYQIPSQKCHVQLCCGALKENPSIVGKPYKDINCWDQIQNKQVFFTCTIIHVKSLRAKGDLMKHFKSHLFLIYFIFLLPFWRLQTMKRPPIGISPYFWSHKSAKGVQSIVNACKIQQTINYGGEINL